MYNPNDYVDPLRRRFQQPSIQSPVFQQPQPLIAQQTAPGPQQPMQWQQIDGDQGQMQQDARTAGVGMTSLLKRFQKPSKSVMPMGGFEGKG